VEPGDWIELQLNNNRFGLGTPLAVQIFEIEFGFVSNVVTFRASSAAPVSLGSQATWGDGSAITWGDGSGVEWSG
jgi:hypothetical protein